MIRATIGIFSQGGVTFDADAQAFFDRVTTAGGSLSATEKEAVNTLVVQMKSDGIWSSMKAIYPMVGGGSGTTAARQAACSQNLKSSSFTGTFTATGWTFASTGVTPNGTSAYMDTGFNVKIQLTPNNASFGVYVRGTFMDSSFRADMGCFENSNALPLCQIQSVSATQRSNYCWDYNTNFSTINTTDPSGFWGMSRTASNVWQSFERNTIVAKTTNNNYFSLPNRNIYIGAANEINAAAAFSSRELNFAFCGEGLTNTESSDFYNAIQAFQTTLSRQV